MLLWQCYQYNEHLAQPDPTRPENKQYFFYQPTKQSIVNPPIEHNGPWVEQTGFRIEDNTPSTTSFTCYITLTNKGKAKATDLSAEVRPFRGAFKGDVDMGGTQPKPIDDSSPLAQISQWVSFPDLDPGQSSTQNVFFLKQPGANYGHNPAPQIVWKGQTEAPPTTLPSTPSAAPADSSTPPPPLNYPSRPSRESP
jgi:hypothetical protein